MNKFYRLLFLIAIIIVGCKTNQKDENITSQSINTMNMMIFNNLNFVFIFSRFFTEKNENKTLRALQAPKKL